VSGQRLSPGRFSGGGTIARQKTILAISAVIGAVFVAVAAVHLSSVRSSYNRFVDRALFENGVQINMIASSAFSREEASQVIRVGINGDASAESKTLVRSAYGFLGNLSGRTVDLAEDAGNMFGQDRFVYVASPSRTLDSGVNDFVSKLQGTVSQVYPNERAEAFWAYLSATLRNFNGTPFFFNSEFAKIDFDNVIRNGAAHRLADTKIERSVVYVNTPFLKGLSAPQNQRFTNSVTLQEIFQEYNLAADVNDPEFKLKTILYDHDEALGNLTGAARRNELQKNAASGLCPFDVMLTRQIGESGGSNPAPVGLFGFLKLQMSAYYHRWGSNDDLFDERCW
jgi:hypothetical protein